MFGKSKKELKNELHTSNSDVLFYRGKVLFIIDTLKAAEENKENAYTTIRKIKDILYRDTTYLDNEFKG